MSLEIPPEVSLERLVSALSLTHHLGPGQYEEWANHPSFYGFSDCMYDFLKEEHMPYPRTPREDLAIQVGGLVITTYWMDVHPGRGVPNRQTVEWLFQKVTLDEATIVSPLVTACAEDQNSALTDTQRAWVKEATTLEGLAQVLDVLDPNPRDPNYPYVSVRTTPITRDHIATVLRPLVAELGEQLTAEGHEPYSWSYCVLIRDQLDEIKQQRS